MVRMTAPVDPEQSVEPGRVAQAGGCLPSADVDSRRRPRPVLRTRTVLAALVVVALAAMHGLAAGGSPATVQERPPAAHAAAVHPGTAATVTASHEGSGDSDAPAHHQVAGTDHCVAVLSASPSAPRVTATSVRVVAGPTGTGAPFRPTAHAPAEPRAPDLSRLCLWRI